MHKASLDILRRDLKFLRLSNCILSFFKIEIQCFWLFCAFLRHIQNNLPYITNNILIQDCIILFLTSPAVSMDCTEKPEIATNRLNNFHKNRPVSLFAQWNPLHPTDLSPRISTILVRLVQKIDCIGKDPYIPVSVSQLIYFKNRVLSKKKCTHSW